MLKFLPFKKAKNSDQFKISFRKNQSGSIELKTPKAEMDGSNSFQFKLADEEQKIIFEITPNLMPKRVCRSVYKWKLIRGFAHIA